MIKAIAIDGNMASLQAISFLVENKEGIQLQKTFISISEALKYMDRFPVDVCFIEINNRNESNMLAYEKLGERARLIFTGLSGEFAIDAFNFNAVDYLLKPF